jgi:hypothetical protein
MGRTEKGSTKSADFWADLVMGVIRNMEGEERRKGKKRKEKENGKKEEGRRRRKRIRGRDEGAAG